MILKVGVSVTVSVGVRKPMRLSVRDTHRPTQTRFRDRGAAPSFSVCIRVLCALVWLH